MRKFIKITAFIFGVLLVFLIIGANLLAREAARLGTISAPVAERPPREHGDEIGFKNTPIIITFETVSLTTRDGLKLHAIYHPSQNGAAVILLHGYRSTHTEVTPVAQVLVKHGYGVLLPDFRGHGLSEGQEITFGKLEQLDVEAAYQYLTGTAGIPARQIGLFGNSMGSVVSILYAAEHPEIQATVAQSPYTTYQDVIWYQARQVHLPDFVFAPMVEFWAKRRFGFPLDDISPVDKIGQIAPRAVFLLQGGRDAMVDPGHMEQLYQAAGEPKIYWFDPDVEHVDFPLARPEAFEKRIVEFYDQYLGVR